MDTLIPRGAARPPRFLVALLRALLRRGRALAERPDDGWHDTVPMVRDGAADCAAAPRERPLKAS